MVRDAEYERIQYQDMVPYTEEAFMEALGEQKDQLQKVVSLATKRRVHVHAIAAPSDLGVDGETTEKLRKVVDQTGGTWRKATTAAELENYLSHFEQEIAGPLDDVGRDSREPGDVHAPALVGGPGGHLVQEHELLAVLLQAAFRVEPWRRPAVAAEAAPAATPIGMALLGVRVDEPAPGVPTTAVRSGYLLPFEIVSIHLLVVLVGAAYLARAKRRRTPRAIDVAASSVGPVVEARQAARSSASALVSGGGR
jgi:hypothetical protein